MLPSFDGNILVAEVHKLYQSQMSTFLLIKMFTSFSLILFNFHQVLDVGWHDSLAPPLERLCSICKQIETWLKKDPQKVAVLHCKVGCGWNTKFVEITLVYTARYRSTFATKKAPLLYKMFNL